MREGQVFGHGHRHDVPTGVPCGLGDSVDHLLGLPDPDANLPLLVPHHHDGTKRKLLAALDDLGDPPHLDDPLLEPIVGPVPLLPAEEAAGFLDLSVHDVDVVPEHGLAAVGGAVDLLVGGGDLLLGLGGKLVEGGWGNVAFRRGRGVEGDVVVGVDVVEEGGVDVGRGGQFGEGSGAEGGGGREQGGTEGLEAEAAAVKRRVEGEGGESGGDGRCR